jgi:phage tail-like protein
MADPLSDPAIASYFTLAIDDQPMGIFTKLEGLQASVAVEWIDEGGNQLHRVALPGRLSYSNVKISRPVCADSARIPALLTMIGTGSWTRRGTAVIAALEPDGTPIIEWTLQDVTLVSWTGPSLTSDGNQVATETLEFAHHGFLPGV